MALQVAAPCASWKVNKATTMTTSFVAKSTHVSFLSQISPLVAKTSTVSLRGGRVSMSLQMEQAAPAVKLNPPTVVEVWVPPESLEGFEAEYERVAASWPADLATTTDDLKLEDYISSAHTLVRRWLPADLLARLERFIHDPNQPPALVIRGLPIDRDLPPTQANLHVCPYSLNLSTHFHCDWILSNLTYSTFEMQEAKMGRYMSETWLVGIARAVGQVFTYESLRGKLTGPTSLVRQIYTTAEKVNQVSLTTLSMY